MNVKYSKPSADIAPEIRREAKQARERFEKQRSLTAHLKGQPERVKCLLCNNSLNGTETFNHRGIEFLFCPVCNHLQTRVLPPDGYPTKMKNGVSYSEVYPALNEEEYRSRRDRIYKPKLEWALNCAGEIGLDRNTMLEKSWLELGCGAGYFLNALNQEGAKRISGIEADPKLVEIANQRYSAPLVQLNSGTLIEAIAETSSDIIVAFFVFEHIDNAGDLYVELAGKSTGTILLFSVPTFGLSSLFDNVFSKNYAQMLDGVVHTQLYTDKSIDYALKIAGYEPIAEWVFGKDAAGLNQVLLEELENKFPNKLMRQISENLRNLVDPWQKAVDNLRLSDERHILAVKR